MDSTPFVWLTVHGQAHVDQIGMPPSMADAGPRALVLGENDGGLLRWGSPSKSRAGSYPLGPLALHADQDPVDHSESCASPLGIHVVVGTLFGANRGPHYQEAAGRQDALGFLLDCIEESDFVSPDSSPLSFQTHNGRAADRHRFHIWLRDGLAWRNPIHPCGVDPSIDGAFPPLSAFHGTKLGALIAERVGTQPPSASFGVLLLDHGPEGASGHHILRTEQRAAQDLKLVHDWAHAIGATPKHHPVLVRV